ncbi:MAG: polyribonucleotide nucleotidyltransferase [Eubacteriales bacterium]|jgi:polyribonucleotide nucleotidyltransferase
MEKIFKTEIAGRPFVVETGKLAQLASGSCLVRYGDTAVLCNATASQKPRDGIDFFPLSVDYEEKLYAVGKIPGSFLKREGKPSDKAILTSRMIDRPLRPLFPKDYRNDVGIVCTVMSVEQDNQPEIAALNGASIALAISHIPYTNFMAGVVVGLIDGEYVINPTLEQRERSEMYITVAGTKEKVVMIEAAAKEVPERQVIDGILFGHEEIKKILAFIDEIVAEVGKPKDMDYEKSEMDHEMFEDVKEFAVDMVREALDTDDKRIRDDRMAVVMDKITEHFAEKYEGREAEYGEVIYKLQKYVVREWLLKEKKRVDGRRMDQIRPLSCEVGLLPRTHGSGLFTRGQTQVLSIATLGPVKDQQMLDGLDTEEFKRYMHQYNFPSYSVGETRPSRGPGRREIGHGALAEKALVPVLPSVEEFPYAIRVVSEVLSSNGSTSQASICGSTLALMDAGVPIKAPVAGISCGLIEEEDGSWDTMIDIQGLEDFYGDMDFKVGGTKKGVTAIQVDIKNDGLTPEIIERAIMTTRDARYYILDEIMAPVISQPREEVSQYAPKMVSLQIPVDKIREVIGQGGKVIQKIVADTGAQIDIDDDGHVAIYAAQRDAANAALQTIQNIVKVPEVGETYLGKVVRLMNFGAFVEILPGKDGLVHISKLDTKRVEKVEDVVTIGDEILVKVIEIDDKGRINLSRRDAIEDQMRAQAQQGE